MLTWGNLIFLTRVLYLRKWFVHAQNPPEHTFYESLGGRHKDPTRRKLPSTHVMNACIRAALPTPLGCGWIPSFHLPSPNLEHNDSEVSNEYYTFLIQILIQCIVVSYTLLKLL